MKTDSRRERGIAGFLLHSRHLVAAGSAVFFVVLGAAFLLVYQNAGLMRDQINDDFNQQQLILARQAASRIDAGLNDIRMELESLRRFLTGGNGSTAEALAASFERTRSKGLLAVGIIGRDERLLDLSPTDAQALVDPHRIFTEFRTNGAAPLMLDRLRLQTQGRSRSILTAVLCAPLTHTKTEVLFALLNVSELVSSATRNIRSGKTGYAWVIDNTGTFLCHPEEDFIGRSAFAARREREPYISFTQINQIMKDRMLTGQEGTGTYVSGWHRGVQGRITKLIAFVPVRSPALAPDRLWSVAVVAPISEVAEAVHRVYVRHFAAEAALIAGMFAFGLLGTVYHRRLSQALEKKMGRQEEYMSSILQNSVDAIIFVDMENRVQVWNRGAELIFGYTAEEMTGRTFHRLIPPEIDAEAELRRIQEELETRGFVKDYIAPRVRRDARRITVDISRTFVRSKEGEIIGSTVIIKDVTEKREWEQRIYNTEKLASIGILAAGVAHEINNPLAVILGFTDLLLEKFEPGTPEYEDLQLIADNGNHAKKIVEDLLGFARITEGLEDTVDVGYGIERVVSIVRNTLLTSKIELAVEVPDSLPRICGDAREFQQVIFNLINNSVAAMKDGGGTLALKAAVEDAWVRISVSDTGSGIPEKVKARIFDPFFTTKKVGEGTGLGLSLCYGIVNKYGGRIDFVSNTVEDNPAAPAGTTFTVSMPVCGAADS